MEHSSCNQETWLIETAASFARPADGAVSNLAGSASAHMMGTSLTLDGSYAL